VVAVTGRPVGVESEVVSAGVRPVEGVIDESDDAAVLPVDVDAGVVDDELDAGVRPVDVVSAVVLDDAGVRLVALELDAGVLPADVVSVVLDDAGVLPVLVDTGVVGATDDELVEGAGVLVDGGVVGESALADASADDESVVPGSAAEAPLEPEPGSTAPAPSLGGGTAAAPSDPAPVSSGTAASPIKTEGVAPKASRPLGEPAKVNVYVSGATEDGTLMTTLTLPAASALAGATSTP